jgi:hypothetical protein
MRLSRITAAMLGVLVSGFPLPADFTYAVEFKYGSGLGVPYQTQQTNPPPKTSAQSPTQSGNAHPPAATGHHK